MKKSNKKYSKRKNHLETKAKKAARRRKRQAPKGSTEKVEGMSDTAGRIFFQNRMRLKGESFIRKKRMAVKRETLSTIQENPYHVGKEERQNDSGDADDGGGEARDNGSDPQETDREGLGGRGQKESSSEGDAIQGDVVEV